MGLQYAARLPIDASNLPMQNYPAAKKAYAQYSKENASVSSVVTLGHDTTVIEVAAVGQPVVLRWVATSDTTASVVSAATGANFDHTVVTGEVRRFVVPIESYGTAQGSVQGINRGNGLYQRVAFKTTGAGSVLLAEF